ncbi:MAG: class I SAM-dependent methyltransferase [Mesorhizobium sp.]|uniref:class I SAM-dependent methyltransferase n=1 Tax=Mesorhizobium sp. M00.F.Ca.ET.217.01.1.1 TaxID=2500529 RepID=UPI000FD832FD|nr:class I SAM-dependent methyltransferase [Mesorhizobium sp. M00.F.Ca.ET.217.01.1.1]TGV85346.1 class I SAM-dependent methyltransferase [Mesorhizobium sp. M00.F.Ca.ET.158.01.1.1]TIU00961.1 MAG: class I SAM-dependent methyltransferase [Mesorhizobium sp.]TGQ13481.1 class I SAM-dependent methyltransferase [Mesorhizobium sp. M00.F.Ca.ET.217.01.1.1]TIU87668.1 MAG: class I SAM-dependent methyltransferase [Mesorhizobium sp.]TKB36466.1 MAG: class I SAM-dependent methyltransferase [Mesorhizobium sp.]
MRNETIGPISSTELNEYFGEDYLYFSHVVNSPEKSDREAVVIWDLLSLEQGSSVLELGCGYGRISNLLAKIGAQVTGLDAGNILNIYQQFGSIRLL